MRMLFQVTRDAPVIVTGDGRNQPQSQMRMVTTNRCKGCLKVSIVAANHSLLIGSCPGSSNEISSKIDVGFLFVEIVHLHHLQMRSFRNRAHQPLKWRCRDDFSFDDGHAAWIHLAQSLQVAALTLGRFCVVRHPAQYGCGVVAHLYKIRFWVENVIPEQNEQVQPLERGFSQQPVVEVVAIDIDDRSQKASPEVTKPPEGGLSPQKHPAKPDGQGVSRELIIHQL